MSYDIYCFRSTSHTPDLIEAQAIVESEEVGSQPDDPTSLEIKRKIVDALTACNPRLGRFQFDYVAIAESQNIPEEQARQKCNHIELNAPEGDPAIQLS